jgi:hypothetical protein
MDRPPPPAPTRSRIGPTPRRHDRSPAGLPTAAVLPSARPLVAHNTRSSTANPNTVTLMTPFIVKNAALSFERSPGFTS